MTVDELKALKCQWYDAAQGDGSISLCYLVGRTLGRDLSAKYGPKRRWSAKGVEIYVDDYGRYMTVCAGGKEVCSTHDCSRLFVPGPWMEVVRRAAVQARSVRERGEAGRDTAEVRRLERELGIGGYAVEE
jgi:hypothetical protein